MAEIAINNSATAATPWAGLLKTLQRGAGAPLLLLAVLAMVGLPLPALGLDVLFTFNIALSVLVVMAVVNIARPLDFGIFPTVLLLATLLRLALNVASTRAVLLHGPARSVLVVMAVVNIAPPLDFGIFPTVLLLATLLRLALNVASTRVVLLHGHEGTAAAGHVIEAFGQFVVGGNYAVGIVVFSILTIINFVVVTT